MNDKKFGLSLISSRSNPTVVLLAKLLDKKHRQKEQLFLCNGVKLFLEAVSFDAPIKYVIIKNDVDFSNEVASKLQSCINSGVTVLCVLPQVFEKMTDESAPQGIITVCAYLGAMHRCFTNVENDYTDETVMMLESIRDPGNLGTMIRNAAAFGIDRLIISSDCADIYSPKTIRSAMGAIFKVKIDICDRFDSAIKCVKQSGKRVLGAALGCDSLVLGKEKLSSKDAVIIGNEGHGLSENVLSLADNTISIPMRENTESLNAATASAILMWEITK